jgi:membrane associated rhomboid family serine protease
MTTLLWMVLLLCIQQPSKAFSPASRTSTVILPSRKTSRHYTKPTINSLSMKQWEGDDIRWSRRLARRLTRRRVGDVATPVRTAIIVTSFFLYIYQSITTLNLLRIKYPGYWPREAIPMILDVLGGSSIRGPLLSDFAFSSALAARQPHRFLTSAFVHGSIFHWLVNIYCLRRQPTWLENGLGWPLYVSAFLVGIIGGNIGHLKLAEEAFGSWICGFSGGIAGLYGLMYMCLIKMGNSRSASTLLRGIPPLMIAGYILESMTNEAHIGGFVGGVLLGILCAPSYKKSYTMRRKNSVDYDPYSREYRSAMGFGVMPTDRGKLSILGLWIVAIGAIFLAPSNIQAAPKMIFKGFLRPGSL